MLPEQLIEPLKQQLNYAKSLHALDLAEGLGAVEGSPDFEVITKPHILTPRALQNREQLCLILYTP
ncbi:hypothetical protein QUA35_07585 [Microcoleus sp. N9_B2]|uniref:hypothetical protein n=1 Tax=unclassified Microcoleus TaxID=2642155 RepID=UPI002FD47868